MHKSKHLNAMYRQIKNGKKIVAVAGASGLVASQVARSDIDFMLLLSSGIYRNMGIGSFAAFLGHKNNNAYLEENCLAQVLNQIKKQPVFFGLNATDPTLDMRSYLLHLKALGVSGINNYPTVAFFDGDFAAALANEGITFEAEMTVLQLAKSLGLLTCAFVFNMEQAKTALAASVDIICYHLGLTVGGETGANQAISLYTARANAKEIFSFVEHSNKNIIRLVYGGPIRNTGDLQFMYNENLIQGFIGGSTFDRLPLETALIESFMQFKHNSFGALSAAKKSASAGSKEQKRKTVEMMIDFVHKNLSSDLSFNRLSKLTYTSRTYLSKIFKEVKGISYQDYVTDVRISIGKDLITSTDLSLKEIAYLLGYKDYSQFYKLFVKRTQEAPGSLRTKKDP